MAVQVVYMLNVGDERLMSVQEAAQHLKCNRNTIYQLMDKGFIKYMKFGRNRKPQYSSLCRFLSEYAGKDVFELLGISKEKDDDGEDENGKEG